MLLEILYVLLGLLIGLVTGLAPGIHVNTVAAFALSTYYLFDVSGLHLSMFIVSLTVAHSVFDFIPSVFLGIPSDDILSMLPGHRLTKEGRGAEAVKITSLGSVVGCAMLAGLLPILFFTIPFIYKMIRPSVSLILISLLLFMVFKEKERWWKASLVVILAALFGIATSDQGESVLYPALTGMFGISSLIFSLKDVSKFPEQKDSEIGLTNSEIMKSSWLSFISSTLLSLIPAIGSSQAAMVSQQFSKKPEVFLFSLGVINSCVGIVSIISLVLIGKARSGAGVVIEKLGGVTFSGVITFVIIALIVSVAAGMMAVVISKRFSHALGRINYRQLSVMTIAFLVVLGFLFDGPRGMLNLAIATVIGCLALYFGVNRSLCMAFLVVPTIIFFMNFT